MDFADRHVIVVGLGSSGLAAARYLNAHGARVSVADSHPSPERIAQLQAEVPHAELRSGEFQASTFADADFLLISPGVPSRHPAIAAFRQHGGEVLGDIELLARVIRGNGSKVIAITGSNGKTTVTSLVGHLCQQAGLDVIVAGNIGLAVLDAQLQREQSGKQPDVWVLELSSFQLETTYSLAADAATVLNISEDHLDRYHDLLDYAYTKSQIFQHAAVQVLNRDDPLVTAMARSKQTVKWFALSQSAEYQLQQRADQYWLTIAAEAVLNYADMQLQGLHNAANALAALALCDSLGIARPTLLRGLKTFHGLAHRVELVDEINSVSFIDDSKGTNVGATVAALNGMTRPVWLIAGGDGKGQDFAPLAPACQRITRHVFLIGRDADKIATALAPSAVPITRCNSLEQATRQAIAQAQAGDVVLLSPACASFDMFSGYAQRAQIFIETVQQIKLEQQQMGRP
ncbi:UDP-N-acetylmuramoyl-L-alanine--D-glutamate ligase [Neisseriaceae bacterium TC5R-5]|nr:UDP-N-acetylmuramoyl-L-alanine--D-glutamate ligase [Neisseriaceae bacterium TC5R-5]